MTTWLSSSWWKGWVADCGIYIGPWPPAPPIPANVPAAAGLDYVITAAAASAVVDGSAIDNVTDLDVWRNSDSTNFGSGIEQGIAPITGGHLFVVYSVGVGGAPPWPASWPVAAPSVDALTLVPPLYASGATGTDVPDPRTGAWGTAFAYPDDLKTSDTTWPSGRRARGHSISPQTDPARVSVEPLETVVIGSALTLAPTAVTTGTRQAGFGVDCTWPLDGGTVVDGNYSEADVTISGAFAFANWQQFIPTGAIEGIDFAANPTTFQAVAAVDGQQDVWIAWDSVTIDYTTWADRGTADLEATLNYLDLGFEWQLIEDDTTPDNAWTTDSSGTSIGSTTIAYPDPGTARSVTLDISAATERAQVTLRVPSVTALSPPVADFTADVSQDRGVSWRAAITSATATATINYPDMHIWIPGAAPPVTYLRMTQRNDNLGISQHPRLFAGTNLPNRPSSVQQPHAPRLPQNPNTYS